MVNVFASIKVFAWLRSTPNFSTKAEGSTLDNRSKTNVINWVSICNKLKVMY